MQTTVKNKVSCKGIGLHGGKSVAMTIAPAPADSGITFKRLDVAPELSLVPARFDAVCETTLGTKIANRHGITVATVEHLLAALWGAGIDNALIELNGGEVPIMDGSSEPFTLLLEQAGIKELSAPRKILRILKTVEVKEGRSTLTIFPNKSGETGLLLNISVDFNHELIGKQEASYDFRSTSFEQSVGRARTFCFEHEVTAMRAAGLALGGSLDNAIVIGKEKLLNEEGLRYDDEFVRHKALDCVGDFFLAGIRIDATVSATRPGHAVNNALLHAVFADETAYVIESEGNTDEALCGFIAPETSELTAA